MSSVQIYTNTSSSHVAEGGMVLAAASTTSPSNHLMTATKPSTTTFPNSVFMGSSLNYLRIKILTNGGTTLAAPPIIHVYGWSRELVTQAWEARKLCTLTCPAAAVSTTPTFTSSHPSLISYTLREIYSLGSQGVAGDPTPILTTSGEAKIYQGDATGGGGFFLLDTIGTELIELHFTQNAASPNRFGAIHAGL